MIYARALEKYRVPSARAKRGSPPSWKCSKSHVSSLSCQRSITRLIFTYSRIDFLDDNWEMSGILDHTTSLTQVRRRDWQSLFAMHLIAGHAISDWRVRIWVAYATRINSWQFTNYYLSIAVSMFSRNVCTLRVLYCSLIRYWFNNLCPTL